MDGLFRSLCLGGPALFVDKPARKTAREASGAARFFYPGSVTTNALGMIGKRLIGTLALGATTLSAVSQSISNFIAQENVLFRMVSNLNAEMDSIGVVVAFSDPIEAKLQHEEPTQVKDTILLNAYLVEGDQLVGSDTIWLAPLPGGNYTVVSTLTAGTDSVTFSLPFEVVPRDTVLAAADVSLPQIDLTEPELGELIRVEHYAPIGSVLIYKPNGELVREFSGEGALSKDVLLSGIEPGLYLVLITDTSGKRMLKSTVVRQPGL